VEPWQLWPAGEGLLWDPYGGGPNKGSGGGDQYGYGPGYSYAPGAKRVLPMALSGRKSGSRLALSSKALANRLEHEQSKFSHDENASV